MPCSLCDPAQITGGAGFVGSHLTDKLMMDGHEVTVVDNFFTGRKRNVEHWIGHENFELINHDVVEPLYIEGGPRGVFRIAWRSASSAQACGSWARLAGRKRGGGGRRTRPTGSVCSRAPGLRYESVRGFRTCSPFHGRWQRPGNHSKGGSLSVAVLFSLRFGPAFERKTQIKSVDRFYLLWPFFIEICWVSFLFLHGG